MIINTPQLRNLLGSIQTFQASGVELRSEHYVALGCDLSDLASLETLLKEEMDSSTSLILCVAEVSVTYMNVDAADALIKWAACLDDGTLYDKRLAILVILMPGCQCNFVSSNSICQLVRSILLRVK